MPEQKLLWPPPAWLPAPQELPAGPGANEIALQPARPAVFQLSRLSRLAPRQLWRRSRWWFHFADDGWLGSNVLRRPGCRLRSAWTPLPKVRTNLCFHCRSGRYLGRCRTSNNRSRCYRAGCGIRREVGEKNVPAGDLLTTTSLQIDCHHGLVHRRRKTPPEPSPSAVAGWFRHSP